MKEIKIYSYIVMICLLLVCFICLYSGHFIFFLINWLVLFVNLFFLKQKVVDFVCKIKEKIVGEK
jgi:hypothetical protein